jgi:hypothetical protein
LNMGSHQGISRGLPGLQLWSGAASLVLSVWGFSLLGLRSYWFPRSTACRQVLWDYPVSHSVSQSKKSCFTIIYTFYYFSSYREP